MTEQKKKGKHVSDDTKEEPMILDKRKLSNGSKKLKITLYVSFLISWSIYKF